MTIAECTTYLNKDDKDKVLKLIRIKQFFQNQFNESDINLFFITYDIDSEIKEEIIEICNYNNIQLVMKAQLD